MKSVFKKIIVGILEWEAKAVLKKYKPKIVAVTGNVGKTSTKDAIYSVISSSYSTRRSEKSFNSDIGVPLTILNIPNAWSNPLLWIKNIFEGFLQVVIPHGYPKWLVLEIGADRPGDIGNVARWVRPDVAVVTRMAKVPVHVEFFSSVQEIVQEKSQLVRALKENGTMVLNADDEDIRSFKSLVLNHALLFGIGEDAEVRGENYSIRYENRGDQKVPAGISFDANIAGQRTGVRLNGSLGVQPMYSALASLAVGSILNIPTETMVKALAEHETPPGRMRILEGVKGSVLIDDSYNSSPTASEEALKTLANLEAKGRKIAVLGDMLELGTYSSEEHKKIGRQVAQSADLLFTVGIRSRGIAEGAMEAGMNEGNIFSYENSREAGVDLEIMIREGDVILVKGSQGVRMEKVVEEIVADKNKKEELLVRQEGEWKMR